MAVLTPLVFSSLSLYIDIGSIPLWFEVSKGFKNQKISDRPQK